MTEPIADQWSVVTAGSWSWTALIADILRFDAPIRIAGPPELVAAAALQRNA